MAKPIYGHIRRQSDVAMVNSRIRKQITRAKSKAKLTELYRRSAYIVTLTYSPTLKGKGLRDVAEKQFHKTAMLANEIADKKGWSGNYDTVYGG